ncbi:MAG: hypothetical protein D3924_01070 [Candidatus Electrothrix sp. AR4]|nr:hypothetical protein [Candidatus Electrothrix sp. AR4]
MKKSNVPYTTLAAALNDKYRTDELKRLADIICPAVPRLKAERVEALVKTVFENLRAVFDQLPPLAQNAVAETLHTWGGQYEHRMFVNKYSASPDVPPEGGDSRKPELLRLFLIDNAIPEDLLQRLKSVAPEPAEDKIDYIDSEKEFEQSGLTVRETAHAALANLEVLLQFVDDGKIKVSAKTGRATAATIKKINNLLYEGDWYDDEDIGPMQSFAWPLLLQGGGLAKVDGSSLKLTPAGRKTLKKDLSAGVKTAWARWEKNKLIDEFSRVTEIKGQRSNRGRTVASPTKRRPMINALLATLQPEKWIALDELLRVMQTDAAYSFKMVNYEWKLYICDPKYGYLDYYDTWGLLQFRYLLVYLFEYCATLGLVDLAYTSPRNARDDYRECWGADDLDRLSHYDGLHSIRVNALGAYAFGHSKIFEQKKVDAQLYSFADNEIVLPENTTIAPGQELFLEKIAERTEKERWRLSRATLLTAINGGMALAEIQETLARESAEDFPSAMEQLFQEAEQRSTAFVNIGQTSLIACQPEFRQQILTRKKLNRLCLPAGNKHVVILPGKEKMFREEIEAMGFIIGE